jgi:hypothetical protein
MEHGVVKFQYAQMREHVSLSMGETRWWRRAAASHQSSSVGLEACSLPRAGYPPCATTTSSFSMLPKP